MFWLASKTADRREAQFQVLPAIDVLEVSARPRSMEMDAHLEGEPRGDNPFRAQNLHGNTVNITGRNLLSVNTVFLK